MDKNKDDLRKLNELVASGDKVVADYVKAFGLSGIRLYPEGVEITSSNRVTSLVFGELPVYPAVDVGKSFQALDGVIVNKIVSFMRGFKGEDETVLLRFGDHMPSRFVLGEVVGPVEKREQVCRGWWIRMAPILSDEVGE